MSTVYGFNNENDINRVLQMLASFEGGKSRSVISKSSVRQDARYAKVLTVFNNSEDEDNDDKEATAVEVAWSNTTYDFAVVTTNPVQYDAALLDSAGATVFSRNNITSKKAMAVDDIVELQNYPHLSETSDWLVVESGGAERPYVIITAVTDAANYIGNVLKGPTDSTVIKTGVAIKVLDATANELEVGYKSFSDVVDDIFYLEGGLLG